MVHGYHLILAAYGFWLPNDPRGSWSEFVGKWELVRFGRSTKAAEHRGSAALSSAELREREAARKALRYAPVQFTGVQARPALVVRHALRRPRPWLDHLPLTPLALGSFSRKPQTCAGEAESRAFFEPGAGRVRLFGPRPVFGALPGAHAFGLRLNEGRRGRETDHARERLHEIGARAPVHSTPSSSRIARFNTCSDSGATSESVGS